MGNKKALVIGINYKGTGNDLRGCINDAINVSAMLKNSYQFTDITLLTEQDATTAGIKQHLAEFVRGAVPGDTLYFHYSGHGSQIRDINTDEIDGYDEIICPYDLNWKDKVITDDDLKSYFNQVPNGVNLTAVLDCCHSGSGIDQQEEYESDPQPVIATKQALDVNVEGSRYLPPPPEVLEQIGDMYPKIRTVQSRDVNKTSLLICGCEDTQTSADALIDGSFQGAATASLIKAVRDAKGNITYRQLIDTMNSFMKTNGFTQRPELNGPRKLYDHNFLASWVDDVEPSPLPVEPVVDQAPTSSLLDSVKNFKTPLMIGGIIAAFIVIVYLFAN